MHLCLIWVFPKKIDIKIQLVTGHATQLSPNAEVQGQSHACSLDVGPESVSSYKLKSAVFGITNSGTRTCFRCISWFFGIYCLWWDASASLDKGQELGPASTWYAVLCWLSWEALPLLNGEERGVDGRGGRRDWITELEERREWKLQLVCKVSKWINLKNANNFCPYKLKRIESSRRYLLVNQIVIKGFSYSEAFLF